MATHTLAVPLNPSQLQPECHGAPAAAAPPSCDTSTTKLSKVLFLLPAACCAFMLYSSFTTIRDSHGDLFIILFVVSSLFLLALLYFGIRQFEKAVADENPVKRDQSRAGIWFLCLAFVTLMSNLVIWGVPAAMRQFEKAVLDKDLVKRDHLKIAIWILALVLNILYNDHVTLIPFSPVMAGFTYGIPLILCLVSCCVMFYYHLQPSAAIVHEPLAAADPEEGAREA